MLKIILSCILVFCSRQKNNSLIWIKFKSQYNTTTLLGSNTHNNNNPGGDGQTGDDGEGQGGKPLISKMELKQ